MSCNVVILTGRTGLGAASETPFQEELVAETRRAAVCAADGVRPMLSLEHASNK